MEYQVTLNTAQKQALASTASEVFLLGGVGLGKSFYLGIAILRAIKNPGVFGLFAPYQTQMNKSTLPAVLDCWQYCGIQQGVHYVINIRPPSQWGVRFKTKQYTNVICFCTGAVVILGGLDNYDIYRGMEFDEVFVDEYRDVKPAARTMLQGRMRGKYYKSNQLKHQIRWATTPPEDVTELLELQHKAQQGKIEAEFYFGSSHLNAANLGDGYINTLENQYDDETYKREVLGQLISLNSMAFCYAFDYERHVQECEYDKDLPLYISFDFNVNPCVATVWQSDYEQRQWAWCIDEVVVKDAVISMVTNEILMRYPLCERFIITGDASGNNRSTLSYSNAYEQIMANLGVLPYDNYVPKFNLPHRESRVLVNSVLQNFKNLKISPKCKTLITDIQRVQANAKGEIDKSNPNLTHALDSFRYFIHTYLQWFVTLR